MKSIYSKLLITLAVMTAVFFTGCPLYIEFSQKEQKELSVNFKTATGPALTQLIQTVTGSDNIQPLFNADAVKKSLSEYGFTNVQVQTVVKPTGQSLFASGTIDPARLDFITLKKSGSKLLLTLTLSPEKLQAFVNAQDQTLRDYIELLAAPSLSGQELTRQEYLEFLTGIYGETAVQELTAGAIEFKAVRTGKTHSLKVIDLLTMTEEKEFVFEL